MTIPQFQFIAMLSVCIPIVTIAIRWNNLEKVLRYLGLFLFWGLLNDLRYHAVALAPARPYFIAIYALSEALFFTWFVARLEPALQINKYLRTAQVAMVVMWLVCYGNIFLAHALQSHSGIFDVSCAIFLTFSVADGLLQLTKYETPLNRQPTFWFFLGILIYFMCSVLIFSFIAASFRDQIWFLHSIFDISKMVLFTIGILLINRNYLIDRSNKIGV